MPTFISTIKFTQQGIKSIADTASRAVAFKSEAEKMGVKLSKIYWTLGSYDGLIIFDAPDDETATAAMLHLTSKGNVHTSTARAFETAEMERIVGKIT